MVELLSPAGSYESLIAAVNAGADAVYMGGARFGARAYAENPEEDKFILGLKYAHRYGAKVYMTVNTLLKPAELKELVDYVRPYYEAGVDGIIVQDLGVLSVLHSEFPDLPLHASTQMTITNKYGARLAKENGMTRIVPARELSLAEIIDIRKNVDIELETFVHGALCYCYSGQCLMSSFIGGRSGNRGRCAQPCRLDYTACKGCGNSKGIAEDMVREGDAFSILSLKDLCSLEDVPKLIEAGIDSFKIEGRMKSPRYTAGVTSIWRKYIDMYYEKGAAAYHVDKKDMTMLADLFDRGGRTPGYYFEYNGPDMMAWGERKERLSQEELYTYLDDRYVNAVKKIKLRGHAILKVGELARLYVERADDNSNAHCIVTGVHPGGREKLYNEPDGICVYGQTVDAAKNKPMLEEDIRKQLNKTGNSHYEWESLTIEIDGDIFMPVSQINELRRSAFEIIEEEVQKKYVRS